MKQKTATELIPLLQKAFVPDQILTTDSMCDGFCTHYKMSENDWGVMESQTGNPTVLRWRLIRAMRYLISEGAAKSINRGRYYLTNTWKKKIHRRVRKSRKILAPKTPSYKRVNIWDLADSLKEVPLAVMDLFLYLCIDGKDHLIRLIKDPFFDYASRLEKTNKEMGTEYTLQNLDQKKLWLIHTTSATVTANMLKENWFITNIKGSKALMFQPQQQQENTHV